MKNVFALLLAFVMILSLAACGGNSVPEDNTHDDTLVNQQDNQQTSDQEINNNIPEEPDKPIEEELTKVDLFIDTYNKTAPTPITDISIVDVTNQESGHYRTEFRLGAFSNAYAKTGYIGEIIVDIVGYGWDNEDIRIYADGISLEQAKEIIQIASPILDSTLSDSDIQDVMTYLDENQEANGYYYGDIGLLLLGKYKESYELMLKVEETIPKFV